MCALLRYTARCRSRHLGARARSDGITDSLAAATTELVDARVDRTQMGDHRSHLLFESAIERSSQLLGEGTEGGSLFLQLLQLIARNTLRREIGHAMLKLVAQHGEAIIDPIAEPVIVGTQDDGRHDTAHVRPHLCTRDPTPVL